MQISRRDLFLSGTAAAVITGAITIPLAIKAAGVKAALSIHPDLLLAGVQTLVREIRQELPGSIIVRAEWALQEVADRLEALPGIEVVSNEHWDIWRQDFDRRFGPTRNLRAVEGLPS